MIQNKTSTKDTRTGKVVKKNKSLLQQSDQTDSDMSKALSPKRETPKVSKSGLKQGKKKMSKLSKRSGSTSSKKDNLHNSGKQEDQLAKQNHSLSDQAQLFKVTSTKQDRTAFSHDSDAGNGYPTSV